MSNIDSLYLDTTKFLNKEFKCYVIIFTLTLDQESTADLRFAFRFLN